ncbi:MAG: type II toxin-antitoxin system MqsA family antitoxin [Candidatus Tectomicrobia bacterium]|nr:type II toxin-antitoxin system MqsA family antitoxin [Candidatus Tectomicrobia bacterium]
MKCPLCKHGETRPGEAAVTLTRGESAVVIKGVPAELCENCGEHYLTSEIAARVLGMAEEAVKGGKEVEVVRFAA